MEEKTYRFSVTGRAYCYGYVTAKDEAEALEKVKNNDYDDILDEDLEYDNETAEIEGEYKDE